MKALVVAKNFKTKKMKGLIYTVAMTVIFIAILYFSYVYWIGTFNYNKWDQLSKDMFIAMLITILSCAILSPFAARLIAST